MSELDRDKLQHYAKLIGDQVAAGMNCGISYVGSQLGLYEALVDIGPANASELAAHTSLHERWLTEWLRHQACNGQVLYDSESDRFHLEPEAAKVLADSTSPWFFASGFGAVNATRAAVEKLPECFKTGIGMTYDDHGEGCACSLERMNNYVPKNELVQTILPAVSNLVEKLDSGIRVADVGCGAGAALISMGRAYPRSTFTGYEMSKHAIDRARSNIADAGLKNVSVNDVETDPLPAEGTYELVTTFDVVHDTPYPDRLLAQVRKSLKSDGVWLLSDIRSFPTFKQNLEDNPSAKLMYGFSLMVCMSSAMSEPDGAGLGTLGFNEVVARQMTQEAGFSRFEKLEYENAVSSYYLVRP